MVPWLTLRGAESKLLGEVKDRTLDCEGCGTQSKSRSKSVRAKKRPRRGIAAAGPFAVRAITLLFLVCGYAGADAVDVDASRGVADTAVEALFFGRDAEDFFKVAVRNQGQ